MRKAVSIEHTGPIATVILDRPEVRNAVDPPTAAGARGQPSRHWRPTTPYIAMVLWGAGGTFCAGADLRAVSEGWDRTRPAATDRRARRCTRTHGSDATADSQARDCRRRRPRGRGRPRTRGLVRPARGRRGRDVRRLLPALGRAADRRRHVAPAAPDRRESRARHDPDRSRGARPTRRSRWDWSIAWLAAGESRAAAEALAREIAAVSAGAACAPIARRAAANGASITPRPWRTEYAARPRRPGEWRIRTRRRAFRRRCGSRRHAAD